MLYIYCWKKLKTYIFNRKLVDYHLFKTSYLVTIVTDHHETWINKQLLKTLGANDSSLRKNSQNLFGRGGCWRPGPSVVFMRRTNKIEDANHYILRTLTGHGKSLSYQELLNICKLDTLECSKKKQSLVLLFKCIRNIGPKYIRDFFSIRETSYNLRGNGVNLRVLKFNLNFMRNSFTYKCAQLWNKRSEDVKLADNVNIFKSKRRSIQREFLYF